ncbi:MAG: metallophosphoesterase [Candidatus Bathyarchaeia archaeon]
MTAFPDAKRVGIVADTHDRIQAIDSIVKRLNDENVNLVLHAGDYVAPFAVLRFKPLKAKLIGIFGNNDGDHDLLRRRFEEIGANLHGRFAELNVGGLRTALIHGEDEALLRAIINSGYYDVIVHGHTHKAEIYSVGRTLVINPGEACGYLSGRATIAILNTERRSAEILELNI